MIEVHSGLKHDLEFKEEWDEFVMKHPDSTFYHLYGWRKVFHSTFGYDSFFLAHRNEQNRIDGILPLFVMKDIWRRKYLISNPFSNFAGICSESSKINDHLIESAKSIAISNKIQYAELRQLQNKISETLPVKNSFVTLYLDLKDRTSEDVWSSLKSRNRGKIRKAEKSGLSCDFGFHNLDHFYDVFAVNISRLGTPIFAKNFFQNIVNEFSDHVDLLSVKLKDQVIASMFLFKFKNLLAEPWVASLSEYNRIYLNNFLYWQAIRFACDQKYEIFDFGRSTVDSGTSNFKEQWGAVPISLYYHYIFNKSSQIPEVDAHNNKYEKIVNVWKKLPQKITSTIGPRVVKYLVEL